MFELTKAEDLAKASSSIGSFFAKRAEELEKTFAFHKAVAVHHDAMAKAHTAHAVVCKATHAGLDDGHELKAHFAKDAAHHDAMATHHQAVADAHDAQAETAKADVNAMKVLASDWGGPTIKAANGTPITTSEGGAPTGVAAMLQETSNALLKKTLESFNTDPEVANFVRKFALEQMTSALGNKLVPDNVRGITPNFPSLTAIPRTGQRELEKAAEVPLEFEKMFSLEDGQ